MPFITLTHRYRVAEAEKREGESLQKPFYQTDLIHPAFLPQGPQECLTVTEGNRRGLVKSHKLRDTFKISRSFEELLQAF